MLHDLNSAILGKSKYNLLKINKVVRLVLAWLNHTMPVIMLSL
jgi:hypothetical protein